MTNEMNLSNHAVFTREEAVAQVMLGIYEPLCEVGVQLMTDPEAVGIVGGGTSARLVRRDPQNTEQAADLVLVQNRLEQLRAELQSMT